MRRSLTLLLLTGAVFLSWWIGTLFQAPTPTSLRETPSAPDSFMEQVTSIQMDQNGQPLRRLEAERMTHFPDDQRTDMVNPLLTLHRQDGDLWTIRSRQGTVDDAGEQVLMNGDVLIEHPDTESPLQLSTTELRILTAEEYAETAAAVRITRPGAQIDAVGMQAYLKTERVELLNQVRSRYDARP